MLKNCSSLLVSGRLVSGPLGSIERSSGQRRGIGQDFCKDLDLESASAAKISFLRSIERGDSM